MAFRPTNPFNAYQTQIEFEEYNKNKTEKDKFLKSINEIARAALAQTDIAKKNAEDAKRDAKFSKTISIISTAVAIAALILSLLSALGVFQ